MAQRVISLVTTITWQIYSSAICIINRIENMNAWQKSIVHYNHGLIYKFDREMANFLGEWSAETDIELRHIKAKFSK